MYGGRIWRRPACNLQDGASVEEDDMTKKNQLFRIVAARDGRFAADDCDQDRWRQVRRHVMRMRNAPDLAQLTVADEPLPSGTARKLEAYVKFGLGEK
jgi:hypothetical protein